MKKSIIVLLAGLSLIFQACRKTPGEGGNSTIRGVVYAKNVRNPDQPLSKDDYEANQKVYITYGDKDTYDDDYQTSPDGTFEFKFLRKGTYKIYSYSVDPTTLSKVVVSKTVELDNNEVKNVTDFVINKDADEGGFATIKGKVKVYNYDRTFTNVNGSYYAMGEDVYLIYGNSQVYNDRTRTNYDGSFVFNKLRRGTYKVYVLSKDSTNQNASGKSAVIKEISINDKNQVVDLNDIVKIK